MGAPASRSQGSKSHPCAHFIRFTEEENKRLHALVDKRKRRGVSITIQAFGRAAILRALNEAEMGKETAAEHQPQSQTQSNESYRPAGLGIRERLQQEREADQERRERDRERERERGAHASASVAESIPHYTPIALSGAGSEIHALARMIVGLPSASRRDALVAAAKSLAHGRTQDEALPLVEQLVAETKRLDGAPTTVLEKVQARMRR